MVRNLKEVAFLVVFFFLSISLCLLYLFFCMFLSISFSYLLFIFLFLSAPLCFSISFSCLFLYLSLSFYMFLCLSISFSSLRFRLTIAPAVHCSGACQTTIAHTHLRSFLATPHKLRQATTASLLKRSHLK
uniref:Uncharacterized protein n=1 Tax=Rhipicephalus pulchellus TaxID=72859 RepID=L7LZ17_RHIPC